MFKNIVLDMGTVLSVSAGKHGLTAGECLFLDDMPANVRGACEAGCMAFCFRTILTV